MQKILFLVTQSEMGGAQRYILEMARGLAGQKYEVLAAAGGNDQEFFGKLGAFGVKTIMLRQMKRAPWPWQISKSIWEIRTLLKRENPDILFLCSTTAGLLGSVAGRLYGKKIAIVYRIGGWAFRDPRPFLQNLLILAAEKLTAPLKDLIIVNSEIDRKLALKYHIVPEKKIIKIYNGLNVNSLFFLTREQARQKLGLDIFNNSKVVGTVANFYKTKGLAYLIGAAAEIKGATFVIIGDGRLRPELEGQIKKLGLENRVILVGRIPDAYQYLKAFDVFALPSLKEGFPWIVLEAMAAGIPVVATKVGALPEILPENFLVSPGDSAALAKKIGQLLDRPELPSFKNEFTGQKMIERTLEALQKYLPKTER